MTAGPLNGAPSAAHDLGVRGCPVGPSEHEVVVVLAGAEQEPFLGLLAAPDLERAHDVVVDVDGAPAVGGLDVGEPQFVVHDHGGLADVDELGITDHPGQAGDVLEQVFTNNRADTPAVAQRRHLAAQVLGSRHQPNDLRSVHEAVAVARQALDDAEQRAQPFLGPLGAAEADLGAAEAGLRASRTALVEAPLRRRRGLGQRVDHAAQAVQTTRGRRDRAAREAAPFVTEIEARAADLQHAEDAATRAQLRDHLDRLTLAFPTRGLQRDVGIDPPGL
jgi:hypothetical protein